LNLEKVPDKSQTRECVPVDRGLYISRIDEQISIPEDEPVFTACRSSGAGGQNVNKVSSRVTLWFDVVNSPTLSAEQKELVMRRLATRIGKDGVLRVVSQQTRSQAENRELAVERFIELLQDAVKQVPIRKKTRVSKGAKLHRLEEKRQHGLLKSRRSERVPVED
jgi:ribosome-associated protein